MDVIVCRLRKKLAAAGLPTLVQNVWGCGYKLSEPAPAAHEESEDLPSPGMPVAPRVAARRVADLATV